MLTRIGLTFPKSYLSNNMWLNIDLTKRITKGNNEKKIQIRYLKKNDNIMTTAISDTNLNPNINLHLPMILKFNITNKTNQSNIINRVENNLYKKNYYQRLNNKRSFRSDPNKLKIGETVIMFRTKR